MNSNHKETSIISRIVRLIISVALIALGGVAWAYFHATAPKMEKQTPPPAATTVETTTVQRGVAPATIQGMGTVVASREVTLTAKVSGDVQKLSSKFVPGGIISRGKEILRLDPADYEIELDKAKSALEKVKADLAIEQGNQTIAREELRLLSKTAGDSLMPTDLALRKPQLDQAKAEVASAEADLRKARLNLERTVVKAPFNAMIIERSVNMGSHVNSQDSLVTIVDTDEYWIEVAIPVDRLDQLDLSESSPAVIRSQTGKVTRQGRAVRSTGKLSESSRMAKVIIAVSDPLGLKNGGKNALVLDDYVTAEIEGRVLESVIELPRSALRDGNTVWVYNNGKLDIQPVTLAWKHGERVFVESGLDSGDQVVISDLSIPVQGMKLELSGNENQAIGNQDPEKTKAS